MSVTSPSTPLSRNLANLLLSSSEATSCFTLHERRSAFDHVLRVLEEAACNRELPNKSVLFFRQDNYAELVMGFGMKGERDCRSPGDPQSPGSAESRGSQNKISAFWKQTVKSTVKSINKTASSISSITNLGGMIKGSPAGCSTDDAQPSTLQSLCARPTVFTQIPVQVVDVLVAAAPITGEALHWAWLLRAVSYRSAAGHTTAVLEYLARVQSTITKDASWFMLLIAELHELRHASGAMGSGSTAYLPGSSDAVEAVAAKAVQLAEGAISGFRTNYTTTPANAEMLALAVQLLNRVSVLLHGGQGHVDGMLRDTMLHATQVRYNAVRDAAGASIAGLASMVEQLVSDVIDDVEHYNAALPATCNLSLPSLSCSIYCPGVRAQLAAAIPDTPSDDASHVDRTFLALVAAVAKLEGLAARWLRQGGACAVPVHAPHDMGSQLLAPHVSAWFAATRASLEQMSHDAIAAERWAGPVKPLPKPRSGLHSPSKHGGSSKHGLGVACYHTAALDEFSNALRAVMDTGAQVVAANQRYASLMERTMSKAVLHHAAALERHGLQQVPDDARQVPCLLSVKLCLCLNDLREIRTRQADLAVTMKKRIPKSWWSSRPDERPRVVAEQPAAEGCIGNRFRLCQGEIERRYTCLLFHVVRCAAAPVTTSMQALLDAADAQAHEQRTAGCPPPSTAFLLQPLTSHFEAVFGAAEGRLDPRVLRRLAREVWNRVAGQLHDALTGDLEGVGEGPPGPSQERRREGSIYNSVDNLLPRIRAADSALQFLNEYFMHTLAHAGLAGEDRPERVKQLANLLAFFLREDFSDSLDGLGTRD